MIAFLLGVVVDYWLKNKDTILMLFIYKKIEAEDLIKEQLKILKEIVERELK